MVIGEGGRGSCGGSKKWGIVWRGGGSVKSSDEGGFTGEGGILKFYSVINNTGILGIQCYMYDWINFIIFHSLYEHGIEQINCIFVVLVYIIRIFITSQVCKRLYHSSSAVTFILYINF